MLEREGERERDDQCPTVDMVAVGEQITDTWRKVIQNTPKRQGKPSVVFRHGTCVILMEGASSKEDAAAKATHIISEYGPVWIATPSADFNVTGNSGAEGIIVTCLRGRGY